MSHAKEEFCRRRRDRRWRTTALNPQDEESAERANLFRNVRRSRAPVTLPTVKIPSGEKNE